MKKILVSRIFLFLFATIQKNEVSHYLQCMQYFHFKYCLCSGFLAAHLRLKYFNELLCLFAWPLSLIRHKTCVTVSASPASTFLHLTDLNAVLIDFFILFHFSQSKTQSASEGQSEFQDGKIHSW